VAGLLARLGDDGRASRPLASTAAAAVVVTSSRTLSRDPVRGCKLREQECGRQFAGRNEEPMSCQEYLFNSPRKKRARRSLSRAGSAGHHDGSLRGSPRFAGDDVLVCETVGARSPMVRVRPCTWT